jgi:hypothetical protein
MSKEPEHIFYQVTTREDVIHYRCGEIGDVLKRTMFGAKLFTSVRLLPDDRLEVQTKVDEERKWEIQHNVCPGRLTPDGEEEIDTLSHAFLSWEEAAAHAIPLIEEEIVRLKKKQEALRNPLY